MSAHNGIATDLARLESRVNQHNEAIEKLSAELKELCSTQQATNIVLAELNTTLKNTNNTLKDHKKVDELNRKEIQKLQNAQATMDAKLKIVLAILATLGTAIIGVTVKLLFFSPMLNKGG